MSDLEISKMLTLSTAHITPQDDNLLKEDKGPLLYKDCYGYMLYILPNADGLKETMDYLKQDGFSMAMEACVLLAAANGCKFLRFDGDGPKTKFLPAFDW